MKKILLNFSLHLPYFLKDYSVFEMYKNDDYFDMLRTKNFLFHFRDTIFKINEILKVLLDKNPDFNFTLSISGVSFEILKKFDVDLFNQFKYFSKLKRVNFLLKPYFNSYAHYFSLEELLRQVNLYKELLINEFEINKKENEFIFDIGNFNYSKEEIDFLRRNGLVYFKKSNLNFKPNLEDSFNSFRKLITNQVFKNEDLFILDFNYLEFNYDLEGLYLFLNNLLNNFELINNFNESKLEFENNYKNKYKNKYEKKSEEYNFNNLQRDALNNLYDLEAEIKKLNNDGHLDSWSKLTQFDHIYYMGVEKNIYGTNYDVYINFMNSLEDLKYRIALIKKKELLNKKKKYQDIIFKNPSKGILKEIKKLVPS